MRKSVLLYTFLISLLFSGQAESSDIEPWPIDGSGSLSRSRSPAPKLQEPDELKTLEAKIKETQESCLTQESQISRLKDSLDKNQKGSKPAKGAQLKKMQDALAKSETTFNATKEHLGKLLVHKKQLEEDQAKSSMARVDSSLERVIQEVDIIINDNNAITKEQKTDVPRKLAMSEEGALMTTVAEPVVTTVSTSAGSSTPEPAVQEQNTIRVPVLVKKAPVVQPNPTPQMPALQAPADQSQAPQGQPQVVQPDDLKGLVAVDYKNSDVALKRRGYASRLYDTAATVAGAVIDVASAAVDVAGSAAVMAGTAVEMAGTASTYASNFATNQLSSLRVGHEERFDKDVCPLMTIDDFLHQVQHKWFKGFDEAQLNALRSDDFFCHLAPIHFDLQNIHYNGETGYNVFLGKLTAGAVRIALADKAAESRLARGDFSRQNEIKAELFKEALISANVENALKDFVGSFVEQNVSIIEHLNKIKALIEKGGLQLFMINLNQCRHNKNGLHTHSMIVQTVFAFDQKTGESYHVTLRWFRVWEQLTDEIIRQKYEIFKKDPKLGAILKDSK